MTPKRLFFTLLVLTVGLLAGAATIYVTLRGQLRDSIADIAEKKLEIETSNEQLNQVRSVVQEYEALRPLDNMLNQFIPTAKDQSEALQLITTYAQRVGVQIQSVRFEDPQTPGEQSQAEPLSGVSGVFYMPLDISFAGPMPYDTALELIRLIENSPRHMSISSITFSPASEEESPDGGSTNTIPDNAVNLSLVVDAHFQRQSDSSGRSRQEVLQLLEQRNQEEQP